MIVFAVVLTYSYEGFELFFCFFYFSMYQFYSYLRLFNLFSLLFLGQFESVSSVMSQTQIGEVGLCDNLLHSEELHVQTQNLNETSTLAHSQSPSDSHNMEGRTCGFIQQASLNNNEMEEKEEYAAKKYDEGEDTDEAMKEEEEEEESEESASLIRCQSPDTPMTDSSFSETGEEHKQITFNSN